MNTNRSLTDIINYEALGYAIYTVENRAIPNMMDGFKPVQRFIVYRALEMSKGKKDDFHKVAAVAGSVASAGYHHGEDSAASACSLLANNWNNNVPFLDGDGNFGSRLVQKASAPRYIFCRVSQNFYDIYKDTEITLKHDEEDHLPPRFYLPIIPTVLLNGVEGIATGYATNILPHSLESVVECTKLALEDKLDKDPQVSFPQFRGKVIEIEPQKYELHGTYNFTSKTMMEITEIPYHWDREKYVKAVLDPLEDQGKITYDDNCSKAGFGFKIKFRKEFNLPDDEAALHAKILKEFKLVEKVSQNIVVIDENGKLNDKFKNAQELIEHFVKVRLGFIQNRIVFKLDDTNKKFEAAVRKAKFINDVINEKIILKGKTRKVLLEELKSVPLYKDHAEILVQMPLYAITSDEAKKLADHARELKEEVQYWSTTTAPAEYLKDLNNL